MLKEDEMVLAFISQHPKTCLTAITKALDVQQAIVVGSLGPAATRWRDPVYVQEGG
jgi:hypothetical protein